MQNLLCRVALSVALIVIHQITIAHVCKVRSLIVVVDGFCETRTVVRAEYAVGCLELLCEIQARLGVEWPIPRSDDEPI